MFSFVDDVFNVNKIWLKEFCTRYREDIGVPFTCICRVDLINEEIANDLASAGCFLIAIGIESGNDRIRQEILNRNMTREAIIRDCQIIHNAGIKLKTLNILGIPPGNLGDDLETVELNIQCRPHIPSVFMLTPFPMTELGEKTRQEGYWDTHQSNSFFETFSWGQLEDGSQLKLKDKVEIETLYSLFVLAVKFPMLYHPIELICRLAGRNKVVELFIGVVKKIARVPAINILYGYTNWLAHRKKMTVPPSISDNQ